MKLRPTFIAAALAAALPGGLYAQSLSLTAPAGGIVERTAAGPKAVVSTALVDRSVAGHSDQSAGGGSVVGQELPIVDVAAERAAMPAVKVRAPVDPSVIVVQPGRNEVIPVAKGDLNRILTPFARPYLKTTNAATSYEIVGPVIYVATNASGPVGVIVGDEVDSTVAVPLTLVPRSIPAISATLEIDGYVPAAHSGSLVAQGFGGGATGRAGDPYVNSMRGLLKQVATGEVPSGFSMKRVAGHSDLQPECVLPGLRIVPGQELHGSQFAVVVSKVTNTTGQRISIDEERCAADGVLAVAAWPYVDLMPGHSTELYVVVKRQEKATRNQRPRIL